MSGGHVKEQRGPGSKSTAERERLRLQRSRTGSLLVVLGVLIAGSTLVLWLYSSTLLYLLCVPAGVIISFLGYRITQSNRPAVVPHNQVRQLRRMKLGYARLQEGAETLLSRGTIDPTDMLLLRTVHRLAAWRLGRIERALPAAEVEIESQLKANMLQAQVEAALQGHDLGSWEPADDEGLGWQARCSPCGKSVYVNGRRLYSLMAERCPG